MENDRTIQAVAQNQSKTKTKDTKESSKERGKGLSNKADFLGFVGGR